MARLPGPAFACLLVTLADANSSRAAETASPSERGSLVIAIDLVVSDAKRAVVVDLKPADLEVSQEGVVQAIDSLKPGADAGHYTLRYHPRSGKPAAVSVRPLRAGLSLAGPDGAFLKPRLEPGLSLLEAELSQLLKSPDRADQIQLSVSVFHFDPVPERRLQEIAIETSLAALSDPGQVASPRLQLLAEIRDERGRLVQRLSDDRAVEGAFLGTQRVVWTGRTRLAAGRYLIDALVRNPSTGASASRNVAFEVPGGLAPLRMSSVCLLQPADAIALAPEGGGEDDPLCFGGTPLMPTLGLSLPPGTAASVRFFVILYARPASTEPLSLRLELQSGGETVAAGKIALPAADADGSIRYVGSFPTHTLREGQFILRLVARQGEATASEEARFAIAADQGQAPIRIH